MGSVFYTSSDAEAVKFPMIREKRLASWYNCQNKQHEMCPAKTSNKTESQHKQMPKCSMNSYEVYSLSTKKQKDFILFYETIAGPIINDTETVTSIY